MKSNKSKTDLKDYKSKLPIEEMQWKAILHEKGLAGVFEFAMGKYGNVSSWRNRTEDSMKKYEGAQLRHYRKRKLGQDFDDESGLPHLAHEAWNVLSQLEFFLDDLDKSTIHGKSISDYSTSELANSLQFNANSNPIVGALSPASMYQIIKETPLINFNKQAIRRMKKTHKEAQRRGL